MRRLLVVLSVPMFVYSAYASDFNYVGASEIKDSKIELPAPTAKAVPAAVNYVTGEMTKLYLLPEANETQLVSYAANKDQFKEFTDMWTPVLSKLGMEIIGTEFNDTLGVLKYKSASGLAVRDFLAEKLHYAATDPAAVSQLENELVQALGKAGMKPVAAYTVNNEALRPTFKLYYLTTPDINPAKEVQLRQLMRGDDIDYDVMEQAGVNIVEKDASFSMVYIGREILFVIKLVATEADVNKKVEDYKQFLQDNKQELIGYRVHKLDTPIVLDGGLTYNYQANIYAYR